MYQTQYEKWYDEHLLNSSGNREERLKSGHGYAEQLFLRQVWYPACRSFDHLTPEYEVSDFRDGIRYIDFAYIRYPFMLAIEIDGYGPHSAKATRSQFSDSLMRQNYLMMDGWRILRFSYDDVNEKPRMCEQVLQQAMGIWFGRYQNLTHSIGTEMIIEQEIVRYAFSLNRNLVVRDVCLLLQIGVDKAQMILQRMLTKGILLSGGRGTQRIRSYVVNRSYLLGDRLFS